MTKNISESCRPYLKFLVYAGWYDFNLMETREVSYFFLSLLLGMLLFGNSLTKEMYTLYLGRNRAYALRFLLSHSDLGKVQV